MALVRIKLADSDRERYGLGEFVEIDLGRRTLQEVRLLNEQVRMDWPTLRAGLKAQDDIALGAICWLAVRRAGVEVAWADFDMEITGIRGEEVPDDDPNSSGPAGDGPTSTPSRRPSRTSTGSSRGRSRG